MIFARILLGPIALLAACGSSGTLGADLGASVPDLGEPAPDLGEPPPDLAAPYYLPAGSTLVRFLSDTASVHDFARPEQVLDGTKDYLAVLETSAGRMVIDLLEVQTPITVNSFVFLALNHYFDGIAFHRVIAGFVAQGGDPNTLDSDPSGWGSGGPGYSYGLEIVDGLLYDSQGVVGMARTNDPNSNGSQFFITLAAQPSLDGQYTIFGRVVEGLAVLPEIVRGEPPAKPTRMTRVYIVAR